MHPYFTVVTPVLNGERFIEETLLSVRAQTCPSWEYWVMDAGSTDATPEIVARHAAEDKRIHLVRQPDAGMYDAILNGFAKGEAPWLYWINADDKLLPWSFELVLDAARRTGADWITGPHSAWDAAGRLWAVQGVFDYPQELVAKGYFTDRGLGVFIQQESTFFKRSLLEKVPEARLSTIRRLRLAGDFLLWTELAKHSRPTVMPTPLGGFRYHARNASLDIERYHAEIQADGFRLPSGRQIRRERRRYYKRLPAYQMETIMARLAQINRPAPDGT